MGGRGRGASGRGGTRFVRVRRPCPPAPALHSSAHAPRPGAGGRARCARTGPRSECGQISSYASDPILESPEVRSEVIVRVRGWRPPGTLERKATPLHPGQAEDGSQVRMRARDRAAARVAAVAGVWLTETLRRPLQDRHLQLLGVQDLPGPRVPTRAEGWLRAWRRRPTRGAGVLRANRAGASISTAPPRCARRRARLLTRAHGDHSCATSSARSASPSSCSARSPRA